MTFVPPLSLLWRRFLLNFKIYLFILLKSQKQKGIKIIKDKNIIIVIKIIPIFLPIFLKLNANLKHFKTKKFEFFKVFKKLSVIISILNLSIIKLKSMSVSFI